MSEWESGDGAEDGHAPPAEIAVASAVRRLAARRVRRAVLPLGGAMIAGLMELLRGGLSGPAGLVLLGGVASGAVMLSYGVQAVRRVLGRPSGAWGPMFWVASWIPYLYGLYLLFVLGLRPFSTQGLGGSGSVLLAGAIYTVLGGAMIRAQWKLSEVHSLAREMTGLVPPAIEP